jgi:hypothetical protein
MAELPKSWERMIKESIGAEEQQIAIKPEGYREIGLGEGLGNIARAWLEDKAPWMRKKKEYGTLEETLAALESGEIPLTETTIGGVKALRPLRTLSQAVELFGKGAGRSEILEKTGQFKIGDKWAWEFSDEGAKLRMGNFSDVVRESDKVKLKRFQGNLGEGLEHTRLYENYPKATDIPLNVLIDPSARPDAAYHGMKTGIEVTARNEREALELLGHEWQHPISEIEGFPRGGMPEEFTRAFDVDPTTAYKMYRSQGGEQISNATAERLLMDDEMRRIIPPWAHMKNQEDWINLARGETPSVGNPSIAKFFERMAEGRKF